MALFAGFYESDQMALTQDEWEWIPHKNFPAVFIVSVGWKQSGCPSKTGAVCKVVGDTDACNLSTSEGRINLPWVEGQLREVWDLVSENKEWIPDVHPVACYKAVKMNKQAVSIHNNMDESHKCNETRPKAHFMQWHLDAILEGQTCQSVVMQLLGALCSS